MRFKIANEDDKQALKVYLDKLTEGKTYDVSIKMHRKKRTIDQNNLLFLWINCISQETGNDKDSLHNFFKQKFIGYRTQTIFGKQTFIGPTTKTLDTKQFTDYLEQIQAFAATELGIALPNPKDAIWAQFYQTYNDQI